MAASDLVGSGTASGLIAFCDYLVARKLAPPSAVNPWKSAAKNVFTHVEENENWGDMDVQSLDVEDYLNRFVIASRGDYNPNSVNAYQSRFRKAIEAYRGYLADSAGWRPNLRSSPRRTANAGPNGRTTAPPNALAVTTPPEPATTASAPAAPAPGLTRSPFPMRSGQMAFLDLPSPIDKDDAARLTQFIRALVFERPQQLPPGEPEKA